MADLGSSFVSGIIQAQQLGMDRRRLRIAEENAASLKNYYDSQIEGQALDREAKQIEIDEYNAGQRMAGLENNANFEFDNFGNLVPGTFDWMDGTQRYNDNSFLKWQEDDANFKALNRSPLGAAIKQATTSTPEELARLAADRKAAGVSALAHISNPNILAEADRTGVDPVDVIRNRTKAHDKNMAYMAEYMTNKLGPQFEGFEITRFVANPDGTYTPMVREAGSDDDPMPMTEGRSSRGDDPALKIPGEDLQNQFQTAIHDDIALNGLQNPASLLKQFERYSAAMQQGEFDRYTSAERLADLPEALFMSEKPVREAIIDQINTDAASALLREELVRNATRSDAITVPIFASAIAGATLEELVEISNEELGEDVTKTILANLVTLQEQQRDTYPSFTNQVPPEAMVRHNGQDYLSLEALSAEEDDGMIAGLVDWAKEHPADAALLGIAMIPVGGWAFSGVVGGVKLTGAAISRILGKKYGTRAIKGIKDAVTRLHRKMSWNAERGYRPGVRPDPASGVGSRAGGWRPSGPQGADRSYFDLRTAAKNYTYAGAGATVAGREIHRRMTNESPEEKGQRYLNNAQNIMDENSHIPWVNRVLNPELNDSLERAEGFPDSTHLLAAEIDEAGLYGTPGNWYAFPTLVEVDGKLVKKSHEEAFAHAMNDGGGAIDFGTEGEEAQRFAEGNYKTQGFMDHFKNRGETVEALRGAISANREQQRPRLEQERYEAEIAENYQIARAEQELITFDALKAADESLGDRGPTAVAAEALAGAKTADDVTRLLIRMPPPKAMSTIWAIVANSPGLNQAQRMAMADDMIAGLETGVMGKDRYDVMLAEDTVERTRLQKERDAYAMGQARTDARNDEAWDRRMGVIDDLRGNRTNQIASDNYALNLANRNDRLRREQEQISRDERNTARDVVRPVAMEVESYYLNLLNGTSDPELTAGTNTGNVRELVRLATSPNESPEVQNRAAEALPEVFALAIINAGRENPQDGFFEKLWRDYDNKIPIQEIGNNLVVNHAENKVAYKGEGRMDVYQGEIDVYDIEHLLGSDITASILSTLPKEEF